MPIKKVGQTQIVLMNNRIQSGRSMIEMLGVLAIVGILSIGSLAAYSMAITSHNANQAINEIKTVITQTIDLYAEENSYESLTSEILIQAGIFKSDKLNVLGGTEYVTPQITDGKSVFRLDYQIFKQTANIQKEKEAVCRKILLHNWLNEIGNDLRSIRAWYGSEHSPTSLGIYNPAWQSGTYELPATIEDANTLCTDVLVIVFYIAK